MPAGILISGISGTHGDARYSYIAVAEKLRGDPTRITIASARMAFGRSKNRRKADTAQKKAAVKGAVTTHGPTFFRFVLFAAITAGAIFGGRYTYDWARTSPTFALKRVTFTGLQRASESDLLRLASLGAGQNLWNLDVSALERVMGSAPWVKSIEISRHFPDAVSVKVVEHEPEAIVALGDLYLLDSDGDPFKRVQAGDALDLPLVSGIDRDAYVKSQADSEARFKNALDVMRAYQESAAGKGTRLSEARIENDEVVLVLSGSGQEIRMGDGDVEQKLARLEKVKAELKKRGLVADVIHLDNRLRAGWVTVKLSASGPERTPGAQ